MGIFCMINVVYGPSKRAGLILGQWKEILALGGYGMYVSVFLLKYLCRDPFLLFFEGSVILLPFYW